MIDEEEFLTLSVFDALTRVEGFRTLISHRGSRVAGLYALGAFQNFVKVMFRFGNFGDLACCAVRKDIDPENERCSVQM